MVTQSAFARSALAGLLLTLILLVCELLVSFALGLLLVFADGDRAQPSLVANVLFSIGQARMQLGAATQSAMHLCALSHTAPCVFPLARASRRSLLRQCWKKT